MKQLDDLSDSEYKMLREFDLLKILYPESSGNIIKDLNINVGKFSNYYYLNKFEYERFQLYLISLGIEWGDIKYINITPAIPDKRGIFHSLEVIDLDKKLYKNYGNDIVLGKIDNPNWSHGCCGYNSFIVASELGLDQFVLDINNTIIEMINKYSKTIESEMVRYRETEKKIQT